METTDSNIKLPPDIFPSDGDWDKYLEDIYGVFINTLIKRKLFFLNLPVRLRKTPEYKDKSFTFWHLISEGEKEEERTPDFRRCERLAWIHWVIENAINNKDISCWENERGSETHVVIWFDIENYVVILAKRKDYFLLKTAYLAKPHRAEVFRKEKKTKKNYVF